VLATLKVTVPVLIVTPPSLEREGLASIEKPAVIGPFRIKLAPE
jgi:hypothetical protein